MIFPRYHQLKAVRNLIDAAIAEGVAVSELPFIHVGRFGAREILAKDLAIGFCIRKSRS